MSRRNSCLYFCRILKVISIEQSIYSIGIQNFESLRQDGYHFNFKTPGIYNRGEWAARHAKGKPFISKCR
ncbi:hypothetical protein [uncultured Phocaeicola sp.]|uniref:hypothetical protein n=1 Tax=uncultured Phocaeicola sp. TaxID=990718 RepID=UPI0025A2C771|nr:hypothetical protein [uncultured Phocaeicola sp.]